MAIIQRMMPDAIHWNDQKCFRCISSLWAIRRHMHGTKMAAYSVPSAGSYRAQSRRKEAPDLRQCLIRKVFRQPVARRQGPARYLLYDHARPPEHHTFGRDDAIGTPEHQRRTYNLLVHVGCVMRHVDRRGRPVVLASGMDGGRIAKTPTIFCISFRLDGFWHGRTHENLQKRVDIISDQSLRERRGLNQKEPMKVSRSEFVDRLSCTCNVWGRCPSLPVW